MKQLVAKHNNGKRYIALDAVNYNMIVSLTRFATRLMKPNAHNEVTYPETYETILFHLLFVLVDESVI